MIRFTTSRLLTIRSSLQFADCSTVVKHMHKIPAANFTIANYKLARLYVRSTLIKKSYFENNTSCVPFKYSPIRSVPLVWERMCLLEDVTQIYRQEIHSPSPKNYSLNEYVNIVSIAFLTQSLLLFLWKNLSFMCHNLIPWMSTISNVN